MKERGILFSAPMVRALLAGTKSQTRRIAKLRELQPSMTRGYDFTFRDRRGLWQDVTHDQLLKLCPYGVVGDRLWVRETWQAVAGRGRGCVLTADPIPKRRGGWEVVYAATEQEEARGFSWRPGIHMPRWASRITLVNAEVRIQRLHDITDADSWSEGIADVDGELSDADICVAAKLVGCSYEDARSTFAALWIAINGADSWKANPYVWVITFTRMSEADRTLLVDATRDLSPNDARAETMRDVQRGVSDDGGYGGR